MTYDLGDATRWEFFFPNVDKPLLVVPGEESSAGLGEEEKVWPPTLPLFPETTVSSSP